MNTQVIIFNIQTNIIPNDLHMESPKERRKRKKGSNGGTIKQKRLLKDTYI